MITGVKKSSHRRFPQANEGLNRTSQESLLENSRNHWQRIVGRESQNHWQRIVGRESQNRWQRIVGRESQNRWQRIVGREQREIIDTESLVENTGKSLEEISKKSMIFLLIIINDYQQYFYQRFYYQRFYRQLNQ